MLAHFDTKSFPWTLTRVFAGMVGETHGGVTIAPGVAYRLNADGTLAEAA